MLEQPTEADLRPVVATAEFMLNLGLVLAML